MDLSRKVSRKCSPENSESSLIFLFAFSCCCLVVVFIIWRKKAKLTMFNIPKKSLWGISFFLLFIMFLCSGFLYSHHLLMCFRFLSFPAALHRDGFSAPVFIAHCCIALNLHNMLNNINFLAFILN